MSIHFYKKGDNKKSLFHLSESLYNELQPVWEKFHTLTGIYLDEYGKTFLYPDNMKLIQKLVDEKYKTAKKGMMVEEFYSFLGDSIRQNIGVDAIGD